MDERTKTIGAISTKPQNTGTDKVVVVESTGNAAQVESFVAASAKEADYAKSTRLSGTNIGYLKSAIIGWLSSHPGLGQFYASANPSLFEGLNTGDDTMSLTSNMVVYCFTRVLTSPDNTTHVLLATDANLNAYLVSIKNSSVWTVKKLALENL